MSERPKFYSSFYNHMRPGNNFNGVSSGPLSRRGKGLDFQSGIYLISTIPQRGYEPHNTTVWLPHRSVSGANFSCFYIKGP